MSAPYIRLTLYVSYPISVLTRLFNSKVKEGDGEKYQIFCIEGILTVGGSVASTALSFILPETIIKFYSSILTKEFEIFKLVDFNIYIFWKHSKSYRVIFIFKCHQPKVKAKNNLQHNGQTVKGFHRIKEYMRCT